MASPLLSFGWLERLVFADVDVFLGEALFGLRRGLLLDMVYVKCIYKRRTRAPLA